MKVPEDAAAPGEAGGERNAGSGGSAQDTSTPDKFPYLGLGRGLAQKISGVRADPPNSSVLVVACPMCGGDAYLDAAASVLGDAIWCSRGCDPQGIERRWRFADARLPDRCPDHPQTQRTCLRCVSYQQSLDRVVRAIQREKDAELTLDGSSEDAAAYEFTSLTDLLAEPDQEVTYRIDGLLPAGGRVLCAAQFKAGKTTLRNNLVRSLADGVPFLDHFTVAPLQADESVAVIDIEMDRGQVRHWLRDQQIGNTERVQVRTLRGEASSFNIMNPTVRGQWAAHLRMCNAKVLLFDCLRPVLDALALDENHDVGRFLVAFDALVNDAEVEEAVVIHHMGHAGERSRGDSRLRDWPDAEWRLVYEDARTGQAGSAIPRYFSAVGRDVDVPESRLEYDPGTRHLSVSGGSRADARQAATALAIFGVIEQADKPLNSSQIEARMAELGYAQGDVRAALKHACRDGSIRIEKGPKNANLHFVQQPSSSARGSSS